MTNNKHHNHDHDTDHNNGHNHDDGDDDDYEEEEEPDSDDDIDDHRHDDIHGPIKIHVSNLKNARHITTHFHHGSKKYININDP